MNRGFKKQVHPGVAAILIVAVLVAVQWAWWKGLIYKPPPVVPIGSPGPSGLTPPVKAFTGSEEATVETIAGSLEPGDADGPGHAARFDRPTGLALDALGNLYVADTGNHRIRRISPSGEVSTVAGGQKGFRDGPAEQAQFSAPCGVAVGPDGAVYVADTGNDSIREIRAGQTQTVLGKMASSSSASGGTLLLRPAGIAIPSGSETQLVVADTGHRRIVLCNLSSKSVTPKPENGSPTSASGSAGTAITLPDRGTIRIGQQTMTNLPISGATQKALAIRRPMCLAPLGSDWLVTDGNHPAVMVLRSGTVEVIAGICSEKEPIRGSNDGDGSRARFSYVTGVVSDGKGHVYVADTANNTIRKITL